MATTRLVLRMGVVLATVLLLAVYTAHFFASWSIGDPSRDTMSIEACATSTGGVNGLWLMDVLVDGQLLRIDSRSQLSGWQIVARRGSELPSNLLFERSAACATLVFQAKHFLAVAEPGDWQGTIRVTRNGREVQAVKVPSAEPSWRIAIEEPAAPLSAGVMTVAAMLFAGMAWWLGAASGERGGVRWLILVLSIVHLVVWAGQAIATTNDSPDYLTSAQAMLFEGTIGYFPPGYPALAGLIGWLAGRDAGRWITFVQHAMAVTSGVWIFLILRRVIWPELALVGGLLTGALSPVLTLAQSVMSEIPALFAMVGAIYFALRSHDTGRRRDALVAGLLTGWAGLMRIVPLAGLVPAICLLHLPLARTRGLRQLVVALTATATVMLVPLGWFWSMSGQVGLSSATGVHLYDRVITEQKLFDESGNASRTLSALLDGKDPTALAGWEVMNELWRKKLSEADGDHLLRAVSQEGMTKHPGTYLRFTPGLAIRMLLADPSGWIPSWGATVALDPRLETPPLVATSAASLRSRWRSEALHSALWPVLCYGALLGTLCGLWLPQRNLVLALAWMPVGCLLATASVEFFSPRYNVIIIPYIVALAVVPIGLGLAAASASSSGARDG